MNDTFCVLPWFGREFSNGKVTPCCLLPYNTDLSALRQDLLSGIKSPACNKCWDLESNGQKSRRQFENSFLDYKLDRDIDKIRDDCIDNSYQILAYQIQTSNLCNQACVTCSSKHSSKWAEIEKKMSISPQPVYYSDIKNLNINYQTAKRIELLGGEPMFDPRTFDLLGQLIDSNNTDCFISIVTNGSIWLNEKQVNILSKFTDLNICVSIDGVGPVFEYMRWPTKWDTLIQNINQYRTVAKSLSVSYTISSLNALYYNETIAWFQQEGLPYNHNIVTYPTWLSFN
jgi:MoaA/NifB/PqqE/SkfB family radical SAM enzyme